ncbi:HlyD family efflux transporter periplasmic adaptor subunit [Rapidithrix thailandica]|uniref:HlyD family efflux transporter periplasmic adaptor subunit n=1 Tax=Rapidithrix thailandica TaxID=413964 RepID=A0AAW9S863_9BACT
MNKRRLTILAVALGIIVGAYFLMGLLASMKEEPPKKVQVEPKKFVKTQPVQYSDTQTEIVAFGRVESAQQLDLVSEVSGRIISSKVPIKVGQNFRKGALLFTIDDPEERLKLKSSKSNFLKLLASILPDFKIDYPQSYNQWYEYFKSVELDQPLPDLPQVNSDAEKTYLATRDVFSTYYTIKSTEARHQKFNLYAPYNGSITEVFQEVGSVVSNGMRIARIIKTDHLELKVPVEANNIKWVRTGSKAFISTEDASQQWEGRIVRIGDVVNQNTQSIDVFIAIISGKYPIFDGLYLKATVPGSTVKESMVMPRNAVFNGNQVYVIEQDSILKVKEVDIHKINQETIVFSGLEPGADLVWEPLINAYNNMKAFKLLDAEKNESMQTVNLKEEENEQAMK